MRGLRVLITNITLADRTGTETYVRDLALGLRRLGHTPIVYCTHHGQVAHELASAAVPVLDDLDAMAFTPDVIHGHHHPETMTALLHFPGVPALFFCHDRLAWHDQPPRFPRIARYVAVDDNCWERLVIEEGIPQERVRVLLNAVDLERFRPRSPLPQKPQRALLFSNNAREATYLPAVREACHRAGVELDVMGAGVGAPCQQPERLLGQYDLVFAKARCALEAAAVGTAVILCDERGLGPMVTTGELAALRRLNLGMRTLLQPIHADALQAQLSRYDAQDAMRVSKYIRTTAGLDQLLDDLVSLYREVISEQRANPEPNAAAELQASAHYLSAMAPFRLLRSLRESSDQTLGERNHWQTRCEQLQVEADRAHGEWSRCQAHSEQLKVEAEHFRCQYTEALAERDQWRARCQQRDADLAAIASSATLRLRDWLVGLPWMGRFLPALVARIVPDGSCRRNRAAYPSRSA